MCSAFIKTIAVSALLALSFSVWGQASYQLHGNKVKKNADNALSLLAFSVVPDLSSSFLSVDSSRGNVKATDLAISQFTGGATISKSVPVYLEGGVAYMRFDPTFVASNGTERQQLPTRWNAISASGGVGWDFPVAENLVFRPIVNFTLGQIASDLSLAARYIELQTGLNLDFLDGGKMNAWGLGGSVMLDYELVSPRHDIDFEWRYTNIHLKTLGGTSSSVRGSASAEASSIYARYRAPTGITLMDRPLRYVLEGANTIYLGDQRGLLGINYMSSIGAGIEFDSSAYDLVVTRTRIVARYAFGQNITGFALGLAMSF